MARVTFGGRNMMRGLIVCVAVCVVLLGEASADDGGGACKPPNYLSPHDRWCVQEREATDCSTPLSHADAEDACQRRGANLHLCPQEAVVFAPTDLCPEDDDGDAFALRSERKQLNSQRMFWTSSKCEMSPRQMVKAKRHVAVCVDPDDIRGEEKRLVLCCAEHEPTMTEGVYTQDSNDVAVRSEPTMTEDVHTQDSNDVADRSGRAIKHEDFVTSLTSLKSGKAIAKWVLAGILGVFVVVALVYSCKTCRRLLCGSYSGLDEGDVTKTLSERACMYSFKRKIGKMFSCLPCCKKKTPRSRRSDRRRRKDKRSSTSASDDIDIEDDALGRTRGGSKRGRRSGSSSSRSKRSKSTRSTRKTRDRS